VTGKPGRRRVRLFLLLSGALAFASLVPLLVSDAVLIRRNRRTLETLEEKYLTRSSAALAERVGAYYASAQGLLGRAASSLGLARDLTGRDPFASADAPAILRATVGEQQVVKSIRAVNLDGVGSFLGADTQLAELDYEFRKAFETAREGVPYSGIPFRAGELGPVTVLAAPVNAATGERLGAVLALISLAPIEKEFQDEARREVRATLVDRQGRILFPIPRERQKDGGHPSSLVSDFMKMGRNARVTRSEETSHGAVLASIAPVGTPDWGVLVERDRELAFASVGEMIRDTVLWSAGALAFAVLLGIVAARRFSQPITILADSTKRISEGEYGATVPVAGTAEIAGLSENFNRMSLSIKGAFEEVQRHARENRELFISSIKALAEAIDAKDPYTRGHSERVAIYASAIARELGWPADEVERVRVAALLHDVGKIGIDDRIIRKPTALTEEEFEIMKLHPVIGASIMSPIPRLADVIPGMRHHHEKWEGGGYPDGLKGNEIPLLARVVSVADTLDAMTTTRPYQKAMEIDFVLNRIRQLSPSRFEPRIVDALLSAWNRGAIKIMPQELPKDAPAAPVSVAS
jgi:putative nucleotidyltransferase with HDIG domain